MKNYLIIGGSTGIGLALSRELANQGNSVYATYNHTIPNQSIAALNYFKLNVLEEELDLECIPEVLDGFVYCPGQIKLAPFSRIKPDLFRLDYELQVIGAVKCLQAVLPALKRSENSSVVFFSTVAADMGFNFHSAVSASKGAIQGLTKALAAEFSPKIRVNAIAPSITRTPLAERLINTEDKEQANANRHPLKRIGEPEDIAKMAGFLLSENSSWITGQIIGVDGGLSTIKM
jgi:NAD(P)-dependent dehydrogenase (short-subunit alcohol dehydrogenase family)